jgi:NADP-dependent 3-hydroxy acid dehydrogenase YdfG
LAARDAEKLNKTLAKVKAVGAEAIVVPTDVSNEEQSKYQSVNPLH